MLDYAMTNRNVSCCILAHEQKALDKLFRIIKFAYDSMDPRIRPELDRGGGSKHELYFPKHGSRIYTDLESRGDTNQWLHVSEIAFIKDKSRFLATLETVPISTGRVTLETTANGMGQFFYEIWTEDPSYKKFFFPWFLHDEYTLPGKCKLNKEEKKLKLTQGQALFRRAKQLSQGKKFIQEYPEDDVTCFLSSGDSVMDLMLVKRLIDALPPDLELGLGLKIYKLKHSSHRYVCGADTAEGVGGDYSVGVMIDVKTREVVARLRGDFKPFDFAHKLNDMCKLYFNKHKGMPELGVEKNNHGHAVLLELNHHIKYTNLYKPKGKEDPGWITDRVTRPIMLNTFIDALEHETVRLLDRETLKECLTFINNEGKIEAAEGKQDDCIIATSISIQLMLGASKFDLYENIGSKIRC